MKSKHIKVIAIFSSVAFGAVGILGISDGVISLLGGGYADNIVIGAMAFLFPLPLWGLYFFLKDLERERWKQH